MKRRYRAVLLINILLVSAAVLSGCGSKEKGNISILSESTVPFYGISYRSYGEGAEYRKNQPVAVRICEDGTFITMQMEIRESDGKTETYIVSTSTEKYSFSRKMTEIEIGEWKVPFSYDKDGKFIEINGVRYEYHEEDNQETDYSSAADAGEE